MSSEIHRGASPGSDRVADTLERERRCQRLGTTLSTLRVFFVLVVQAYMLLGFAFFFVRPPSPSFYIALWTLLANTILGIGCLLFALRIRKLMLRLMGSDDSSR